MKKRIIRTIAFIILGILVLLSGRLAYADLTGAESGYCVISSGEVFCNSVQNSAYGSIFGVKVSYLGLIAFILLFILYSLSVLLKRHRLKVFNLYFLASLIGALFSLYFIFVQFFVLRMICSTCLIIDFLAVCVFVFALIEKKKRR